MLQRAFRSLDDVALLVGSDRRERRKAYEGQTSERESGSRGRVHGIIVRRKRIMGDRVTTRNRVLDFARTAGRG